MFVNAASLRYKYIFVEKTRLKKSWTIICFPQVANSGSSVAFNCSVEGGDARVRWLHDGVPVGGGERTLRVHGVVRAHRGMYQCFAERDLDSAQAAAELRLGGKTILTY